MDRTPGLSVRLKLILSYAGLLMFAGALMLAAMWLLLLRYIPDGTLGGLAFNRLMIQGDALVALGILFGAFAPVAAQVLVFLLVFGLVGGWILAGRMLAPLTRITDATRMAANGSLSHRIGLEGPSDEFRELADASGDMTPTIGSHALLLQWTTNLVHNAIVHNLPEQGSVWVTTSVHPKRVLLRSRTPASN